MQIDPTYLPLTLVRGADQTVAFQRVADGFPMIPSRARATLRDEPGGTIWLTADSTAENGTRINITSGGFIYLVVDKDSVSGREWLQRRIGGYDLFVEFEGEWQPWLNGPVRVVGNFTEETP